jgi:hypothetical protein
MVIKTKEELAARRARVEYGEEIMRGLRKKLYDEGEIVRAIEQEIAEYIAEFKPGARVLYEGTPFVITEVTLDGGKKDGVHYQGKKIKKDGTPGGAERRLYLWRGDAIVLDPQQLEK